MKGLRGRMTEPSIVSADLGRPARARYGLVGAECCPRTIDMWNRYVGVPMDPKYSDQDVADIVTAILKVYPVIPPT
jgi:hypothetical protein